MFVGVSVTVGVTVGVFVGVSVTVGVTVGVFVGVSVGVIEGVTVAVVVGVGVGAGVESKSPYNNHLLLSNFTTVAMEFVYFKNLNELTLNKSTLLDADNPI